MFPGIGPRDVHVLETIWCRWIDPLLGRVRDVVVESSANDKRLERLERRVTELERYAQD